MSDRTREGVIKEVLPKSGLVYSEKGDLTEVLCKPKIMPIKSATLERIEKLEKEAAAAVAVPATAVSGSATARR